MSREERDALKRKLIAENPEVAASLGLLAVDVAVGVADRDPHGVVRSCDPAGDRVIRAADGNRLNDAAAPWVELNYGGVTGTRVR